MLKTNLSILRLLAYLEGVSFLILIGVGMPLKYMYQMPKPNMIIGMTHGVLFLGYCAWLYMVREEKKWKPSTTFWAFLAALLPFGTFVADVKIFKEK